MPRKVIDLIFFYNKTPGNYKTSSSLIIKNKQNKSNKSKKVKQNNKQIKIINKVIKPITKQQIKYQNLKILKIINDNQKSKTKNNKLKTNHLLL